MDSVYSLKRLFLLDQLLKKIKNEMTLVFGSFAMAIIRVNNKFALEIEPDLQSNSNDWISYKAKKAIVNCSKRSQNAPKS